MLIMIASAKKEASRGPAVHRCFTFTRRFHLSRLEVSDTRSSSIGIEFHEKKKSREINAEDRFSISLTTTMMMMRSRLRGKLIVYWRMNISVLWTRSALSGGTEAREACFLDNNED
jgi:hypothetical protein